MNLEKILVEAKIDELRQSLPAQGYKIKTSSQIAGKTYDLVATLKGDLFAYSVKAGSSIARLSEKIGKLREHAKQHGAHFRLVVVNPPHEVEVTIDGLEQEIEHYLAENMPDDLTELSSGTGIDSVDDIEVDSISIDANGINVVGTASVSVDLQYGGGEENDGITSSDSFPLEFDIFIDQNGRILSVESIEVDTSGWYE